jgi:hypothetical protein
MEKKRKIAMAVTKTSFKEAEEADDLYWSKTGVEERLNTLFELRKIVFGESVLDKLSKVVFKRNLYEED